MLNVFATFDPGQSSWFWLVTAIIIGVLFVLNLLVFVAVHVRRLTGDAHRREAHRFRESVGPDLVDKTLAPPVSQGAVRAVGRQVRRLGATARAEYSLMLMEQLKDASPEDRAAMLEGMRRAGAVDRALLGTRRLAPWRRAWAAHILGLAGAEEAVPRLIETLADRDAEVRKAVARSLGQIGGPQVVAPLRELFLGPGRVNSGAVYDAMIDLGPLAGPVFKEGLESPNRFVRVPAAYGAAEVLDPAEARSLLGPLLEDSFASVRTAAASALGKVGGERLGEELARACRDDEHIVRRAAVAAIASYDDPEAVQIAARALDDPDRDTAIAAGQALVQLSRRPHAGHVAQAVIAERHDWPIERAQILASVGAV